jgi:DNA-binding NarL/FixJ family response regulator
MRKNEGVFRSPAEIDAAIDAAFAKVFGSNRQAFQSSPVASVNEATGQRGKTEQTKQILSLHWQGASTSRIAKLLGLKTSTVSQAIWRYKQAAA